MSTNYMNISKYVLHLRAQNAGFQLRNNILNNIPAGNGTVSRYIASIKTLIMC